MSPLKAKPNIAWESKDACDGLLKLFTPIINRTLPPGIRCRFAVRYVEYARVTDMHRYEFTIGGIEPLTAGEVAAVATALQFFWSNEHYRMFRGAQFLLGDGDDSGAVQFEDGRFHIWLRTWLS